ncbi:hypothetical protein D3C84_1219720 [compost metagenome]
MRLGQLQSPDGVEFGQPGVDLHQLLRRLLRSLRLVELGTVAAAIELDQRLPLSKMTTLLQR